MAAQACHAPAQPLPPLNRAFEPLQKPIAPALAAYSAASLYGVKLERPPIIIQGVIPAGLSVLVAPPKYGKSWMALGAGIAVSTGTPFLGMSARQGDVLYLDLESRQFRIQDRLRQLLPGNFPGRLWITHDAQAINAGLLDQLRGWCQDHPQTSLIVIDTLGRVKGGGRRAENAYEADTRIFGELQRFAQQHKLAVLVVHHLRKSGTGDDSDPIERISGSMGLAGCADAILMLTGKRGEAEATLTVTARDFEGGEYVLRFDRGAWALQSTDAEGWHAEQAYTRSGVVRAVLALMWSMNPPAWQGEASQLLEALQGTTAEPLDVFNVAELGRELGRLAHQLRERDGVIVLNKKVRGRRVLSITQPKPDEL